MKTIKAIIILSCIIYTLQISRVETKLEASKRAEKYQSRKVEYQKSEKKIAKSLMARLFNVSILVGQETVASIASFDAKDIKKPIDGKVRGVYLTFFTAVQPSLKALLVAVTGTTVQYLPYRSLASPFGYESPAASGKIISTTMQAGTAFTNIRIQFQYDPDWDIISSEEINTLVGWLNTLRIDRITLVKQLKGGSSDAANAYYTSKASYDAALKGAAGIDSLITKSTADIAALKSDLSKNDDAMKALQVQISAKDANLIILSKSQTDATFIVSQDDQFISDSNSTMVILIQQQTDGKDTSGFQNTMDQNKAAFNLNVELSKDDFGSQITILQNAAKELFVQNPPNLTNCNNFIRQATPTD